MKFGPRRGHFMFIFERFFRDFGLLALAVIVAVILDNIEFMLDYLGLVILVLFAPIKRLKDYLFTYYSIDNEKLLIESGMINKKRIEIPLSNITTVDFTQTMLFQLVDVYSVNVDNASNVSSSHKSQVSLTLKSIDAIVVKKLLLSNHGYTDDEIYADRITEDTSGNTVVAGVVEIFLLGLLKSKAVIVFQLVAFGAVAASVLSRIFIGQNVDAEKLLYHFFFGLSGPLVIGGVIFLLYLAGVVVSVIMGVIKYYGFRITNRENSIFIEYGLLTRKTFTLMKDKISGVNFKQSLFMRLFGRGTLEVFAIGYGNSTDDEEEISVLYPLLKNRDLYEFIARLIPEFQIRSEYTKAQRKALPYFFICPRILFAVLFFVAALITGISFTEALPEPTYGVIIIITGIFLMMLAIISVVLEYYNTAIYGNDKNIGLIYGGFNKRTVFAKMEKVESIRERATTRKKRERHITTITLGLLAPIAASRQKVRNLSLDTFHDIKEKLMF